VFYDDSQKRMQAHAKAKPFLVELCHPSCVCVWAAVQTFALATFVLQLPWLLT
jgi:hypothetical protein